MTRAIRSPGRLQDRVALVSGGGSGIGAATCELFAQEGAQVVCAEISERRGADVVNAIARAGGSACHLRLDAGDAESWGAVMEETRRRFGGLDVLVNNAYSARAGDVDTMSEGDWHLTFRVTAHGVFLGMRAATAIMRDGGAIVNIASTAAYMPPAHNIAYSAAKAAVVSMTKSAAVRLGRAGRGIRANVVAPGATDTPALRGFFEIAAQDGGTAEEARAASAQRLPLGYIAAPSAIAQAILFLASDEAAFITGAELLVDGGLLASRG